MRFNLPNEKIMNRLFRLVKRIYKSDFATFIKNLGQRIFYISNNKISAVVVYDPSDEKIEVFNGNDALLTCHSLFSGDEKSLDFYGYDYLTIGKVGVEEDNYKDNIKLFNKYKFLEDDGKKVLYLSNKSGQYPTMVDADEALLLIDILEYILEIKRLFDEGVESLEKTDVDCVLCFEFDDEQLLYSSSCINLNSFDFLPNLTFKTRKNVRYVEKLKEFPINPGTLYLGQMILPILSTVFSYDNNVKTGLNAICLYAASDTGEFDYCLYDVRKVQAKKALKENLLSIFDRMGLFDLIVTDNYTLYLAIVEDLETLNIEVKFDPFNRYNGFIYTAVKSFVDSEYDKELVEEWLLNIKRTYSLVMYDIDSPQTIFEEELEEDIDEEIDTDTNFII